MDAPLPRYTYDDMQKWDEDTRWELIDGHPYAMSAPSLIHQSILGEIHVALKLHFKGSPCRVVLAPFDVKFSDINVVQPDLIVACSKGLGYRFHQGPPDLVIEILSPSTLRHDRIRKLNLYANFQVPEYWLVTQQPLMVEVLQNQSGSFVTRGAYDESHILQSPRFPDLQLDLGEIARALPPQDPIPDEVREGRPPTYQVPIPS
jgi:Uma2 family endonuclease